jgi:hypothetical protein
MEGLELLEAMRVYATKALAVIASILSQNGYGTLQLAS